MMQIPQIKQSPLLVKTPNPNQDLFDWQSHLKADLETITNDLKHIVYEAELVSENASPSSVQKSEKIARLLEINLAIEDQVKAIITQVDQEMECLKPLSSSV